MGPFHQPILSISEDSLLDGPEDNAVACEIDYQVPANMLEDVAQFLRLLQQTQNEIAQFKSDQPDAYQALEDHPFFEFDYCRKRTQVRNYAADIIGLVCRETYIPKIKYKGIGLIKLNRRELLVAARYEFHAYMHDFFLTALHAIEDLLDPDGVDLQYKLPPLPQQQVTSLEQLRSKLEPVFEYFKAFCDDNESVFREIVYEDANYGLNKGCRFGDGVDHENENGGHSCEIDESGHD